MTKRRKNQRKAMIILASSSPRRIEMMRQFDLNLVVQKPEVDERHHQGESPRQFCARLSREKAAKIWGELSQKTQKTAVLLAADTIVALGSKILGKPTSRKDAHRMVKALSGREHEVFTAVTVCSRTKIHNFVIRTRVTFRRLKSYEIKAYVASPEPYDKAGGYAAQGLGMNLIERIAGSYTNVVGLPMAEVANCLRDEFEVMLLGR